MFTKGKRKGKRFYLKAVLFTHRWLGLVLSSFFVIWCLSGFVMMYKDFPGFSGIEELRYKPALENATMQIPQAVFNRVPLDSIASLRIESVLHKPMVQITDKNGKYYCFDTDTAAQVKVFDTVAAVQIVQSYFGSDIKIKTTESIKALDQWIPRSRYKPHFPIHKITWDDGLGTVCYVSSQTGEILQKLNRSDKVWAWLGAIPHWIYFKDLRIHTPAWRAVVIAISSIGVLLSIAGILLGVQRTVLAKKKEKRTDTLQKEMVPLASLSRFCFWHFYFHLDTQWPVFHEPP